MTDVVVAGHICLDIIPQFETSAAADLSAFIAPGRLTEVGAVALSTGGAVSNTGLNLHRLGIDTALMGKVGQDLFGRAVLDIVARYGEALADGMVIAPGAVSSYTIVINPPGIDRAFLHCPGANHTFGADDVRYDLLETARTFHFGYPPLMQRIRDRDGAELTELFRRAEATGVTTSLDMCMPDPNGPSGQVNWRVALENTLPYVDIFAPSFEELLFMLARERFDVLDAQPGGIVARNVPGDVQALADQAVALGARIVLLKVGTCGAYLRTAPTLQGLGRGAPADLEAWSARELWAPCFVPDRVAGTTGSGDATIAGFLAAILRGQGPADALAAATAVGACSVEGAGALDGVRTWEETTARIAAGWARLPLVIDAPGWHWDAESGLWLGPRDLVG